MSQMVLTEWQGIYGPPQVPVHAVFETCHAARCSIYQKGGAACMAAE